MAVLPPWPLIEEMLRMLVAPAFAGAVIVLALVCTVTRSATGRMIGGVAALAAGLWAGNHWRDLLEWWPVEAPAGTDETNAIPWWSLARGWPALLLIAADAMVAGLLAEFLSARVHPAAGLALRAVAAAGTTWWLADTLPPWSHEVTFAVLAAGTWLTWEALRLALRGVPARVTFLLVTAPWGAAAAIVLLFAHSARFADLAILMSASACGAGLVAALWKVEAAAMAAGPAVFFPALILAGAGNTYSEVPIAAFACVAFAPCGLWLLLIPSLKRVAFPALLALAIVAIPCAAGVAIAARAETMEFGE